MKLTSFEYSGLGGDLTCIGDELSKDVWKRDPQLDTRVSVDLNFTKELFSMLLMLCLTGVLFCMIADLVQLRTEFLIWLRSSFLNFLLKSLSKLNPL